MALHHTPGPWHVGAKPSINRGVYDAKGNSVAGVRGSKVPWIDRRCYADALLIAAAPDMLQLLRDAWDAYMCDPNPQALTATMNKVEELLARLDGDE